jgi:ADP-ribosylglycohydrolase
MTHNHELVIESAEFFARVTDAVLKGSSPLDALVDVSEKDFHDSVLGKWVKEGIETKGMESVPTIGRFGQSCHVEDAFPGVVHLLAKYEANLEEALVQAVMAGGDSAGRGLLVGMVLGAHLGREKIPAQWVADMKKGDEIIDLLDRLS